MKISTIVFLIILSIYCAWSVEIWGCAWKYRKQGCGSKFENGRKCRVWDCPNKAECPFIDERLKDKK